MQIHRVDSRHSGTYLCKAETKNPDWTPQASQYDPSPEESGAIESPILVQLQAIRGIVFSPPRILPGSPLEVPVLQTDGSAYMDRAYIIKRRVKRESGSPIVMTPAARYHMQPTSTNIFERPMQISPVGTKKTQSVVKEGGQLVLECQARGRPSPQLLWFRGGMGSSMLPESKAVTFDQRIKEALQHLPLSDVQRQLGVLIADSNHLLPAISQSDETRPSGAPTEHPPTSGETNVKELRNDKSGRFELSIGIRKDDTGDPVITVSRLTINQLAPSDATRYTCLALLDLGQFGGNGNYTDVGSVFPEVVLRPRFIKTGTHLQASGYPGENCTLTCEAYGGLSNPNGLRIRFLRGSGVPKLIELLTGSKQQRDHPEDEGLLVGTETTSVGAPASDAIYYQPRMELSKNPDEVHHAPLIFERQNDYEQTMGNGSIQVVTPELSPRYHLSLMTDPRNPYISVLRLHISGKCHTRSIFCLRKPKAMNCCA
ncbi:hypothetical protein PHET_00646 [Paragonimus heterotremus]|uniref:Ig-like domain-containing protein n=1 Tax=Paragonimus heterotremus TaxID=100268 RepID=A0A8J4TJ18_9TREM|nr:hypothetical protein PHET_00646 [Paragonimus heterotremus]